MCYNEGATKGGPTSSSTSPRSSGSPVAPSRTCRLFPRRDSRSPHLSFVHPRSSFAPLSSSTLFFLLLLLWLSLPLSLSLSYFLSLSLNRPHRRHGVAHTCTTEPRTRGTVGGTCLFLDIFVSCLPDISDKVLLKRHTFFFLLFLFSLYFILFH